jgi:hypothetical protein
MKPWSDLRYGHGGKPGEVLEVDTAVCTEKVLKVT